MEKKIRKTGKPHSTNIKECWKVLSLTKAHKKIKSDFERNGVEVLINFQQTLVKKNISAIFLIVFHKNILIEKCIFVAY